MASDESVVVYEEVLDDLLATLRENILNRRENWAMPAYDEEIKAVQRRAMWVAATEKDLEETVQLTLIGSGDDVETRDTLRERVKSSMLDMAAWLVHGGLVREFPRAQTRKEIAEERQRELQAEAETAARRAAQPELFGAEAE